MLLYWNRKTVTGLLLSNLGKKLIWKFIDIFPNQVLNFLNIFIEHGKMIANLFKKSIERILQLLRSVIVVRL